MRNKDMESFFKQFVKKIIKFCIVGGLALLGNLLITYIVSDVFKLDYNWSLVMILIFNCTVVFYLQKKFTFQNNEKDKLKQQIISYFLLLLFVLFSLKMFVPVLNKYIENYTLCTFIVLGVITIVNFTVQNFFIFNNRKGKKSLLQ